MINVNFSMKIGFLNILKEELLFSSWKECFFLLTNVGLVSFKKEGVNILNKTIKFNNLF